MRFAPTVVVGPSGVGKGTILASLCAQCPEVWLSVSVTTRSPRPGEIEGQHYYFLTPTQFDELVDADGLLEWARYQDHCYGTPKAHVLEKIDQGRAVVMELDVQGARQVVQRLPQARTVFLAPPSWDELERRLRGRGTESATAIERRLVVAKQELEFQNECDRVVVNREVASAVAELVNFIGLGPMGTSAAS